nr:hypothetical protein [Tanacetum cinerariifolium]
EKAVTFSNCLFNSNDDFISSDDKSLFDEDVPEDNVKIYSNPLFEFDDKYISSGVNPLFDEVLKDIECKDSYDPTLDESTFLVTPFFDSNEDEYFTPGDDVELLFHHDPSIPKMSVASILEGVEDLVPIPSESEDTSGSDREEGQVVQRMGKKEVDELKAERLAKIQDPLALMANSINPYAFPAPLQDQPSFNQNYMQQPMPNPKDITDPSTPMNMVLTLMAKAFKLNYSTPTNNNHMISLNPRNRQIAQPGMNMGQDRQMQMVGGNVKNQFRQYAGQNVGNLNGYNVVQNVRNQVVQNAVQNPRVQNIGNQNGLIGVLGYVNQNQNGNGNLVAAHAEGNAAGHNGNQIKCYNCRGVGHFARNCMVMPRRRDAAYLQTQLLITQKEEVGIQLQAEEFDLMAAAADLDEIKEVNANYILMANLQQASTSGTQTDKAPVYDSDGSAEVHDYENCYDNEIFNMFTQEEQYTELLEPIPKPHQVPQNDNDVIFKATIVEQSRATVEQHPANLEEKH